MEFSNIVFLLIVVILSFYPILIAHRLYHQQGKKFYLFFIYYDGLGKAFFLTNHIGRHLIDSVLSENASTPHTNITVGILINFIAYPFLALSTYFFASFLSQLCSKKLPPSFKWPFLILIPSGVVFYIFLIREVIVLKIQDGEILNNHWGIIIGNVVFYGFFYFAIFLMFRYSSHLSPKKKRYGIRLLGLYYFVVYSLLIFYYLLGFRYFQINDLVIFMYMFFFNIPVGIYLKYHISTLFKRPSIGLIRKVQENFGSSKITKREAEIIAFVCQGKTNKEIGDLLYLSVQTIKNSLYNIYKKIGVKSRAGLINSLYED